jgi:hypothetical protein
MDFDIEGFLKAGPFFGRKADMWDTHWRGTCNRCGMDSVVTGELLESMKVCPGRKEACLGTTFWLLISREEYLNQIEKWNKETYGK